MTEEPTEDNVVHAQPKKRQYTLKGVEAEAVELMRAAAVRDGMKIGAWVSLRLREAARESLETQPSARPASGPSVSVLEVAQRRLFEDSTVIPELLERISELEAELKEVARTQRSIMARLLHI